MKKIIGWSWDADNADYIFKDSVEIIFKLRPGWQEKSEVKILSQSFPEKGNCGCKGVYEE